MSSFRIGTEAARLGGRVRGEIAASPGITRGVAVEDRPADKAPPAVVGALERLTKWIPADTLALYVPGVTFLDGVGTQGPVVWFLAVMLVATPAFVLLGAWSTGLSVKKESWVAAGLATAAFAIWSISVPLSGWHALDVINSNRAGAALIAAVGGLLFGYFAEGVTLRVAMKTRE